MDEKLTKEQALEYCFKQIKASIIGVEDYNYYKQYMYRHKKGNLNVLGMNKLFKRFGVTEHCYFTIDK